MSWRSRPNAQQVRVGQFMNQSPMFAIAASNAYGPQPYLPPRRMLPRLGPAASLNTDREYRLGYERGYNDGNSDRTRGVASGYVPVGGATTAFNSGRLDGYTDGYRGLPNKFVPIR